ncbi:membrane protein insertion efficiency factor YidD [Roseateles sp. NT4]
MAIVRGYRLMLSPWLGNACRFEPTCSRYSLAALEKHGALAGSYLTVHRILRCHPLCAGGHDPVPDNAPRLFSRLTSPVPRAPSSSPESLP